MKRCPECDSSFPDTNKFCDLDGAQLVADDSDSDPNPLFKQPKDRDLEQDTLPESDTGPSLLLQPTDKDPQPDSPAESDSDPNLLVPPAEVGPGQDSAADVTGAEVDYDSGDDGDRQSWKTLAIVAVAGIAIGVVLFIAYQQMTREAPVQNNNVSSNVAVTQQPMPTLISPPEPIATATRPAEPSPSPSVKPTPAAPAASPRVTLSSSPVSTSGSETARRGPVTIRLTDGTKVDADEVWETGEGIWYRRRGLVTLLKRDQIKAIDKVSAPAAASPSKSP